MGSLSILQWIFLTQKSNWGLLHCRQILYQLSYQGSLKETIRLNKSLGWGPNRTSVLISGRDDRGTYSQRKQTCSCQEGGGQGREGWGVWGYQMHTIIERMDKQGPIV